MGRFGVFTNQLCDALDLCNLGDSEQAVERCLQGSGKRLLGSRRVFGIIVILTLCLWIWLNLHFILKTTKTKTNHQITQQLSRLETELLQFVKYNSELLESLRFYEKQFHQLLKENVIQKESHDNDVFLNSLNENEFNSIEKDTAIGVLVIACSRTSVKRNLDQLLRYRPSAKQFPIIVSQDCGHEPTTKIIQSYGNNLTLIQQPDLSDIPLKGKKKKFKGYYKIARHYGWALKQMFHDFHFDTIIVVEDDLDISPDFFEYFLALLPVLKADSTLWCVSAWNDNGKEWLIANDPELLYRTDFFPGLGWMMRKNLWSELETKWPDSFWDDWFRQPAQRKDRACIRPEVSRTKTFGKIGVSRGMFYDKHLKFFKLNDKFVQFTKKDLSYLLKDNYDLEFIKRVYGSVPCSLFDLVWNKLDHTDSVRITYNTMNEFKKMAKALGLMNDFKSGVPRAGYRGIVSFVFKGRRVYLAPPADWKAYNSSWS